MAVLSFSARFGLVRLKTRRVVFLGQRQRSRFRSVLSERLLAQNQSFLVMCNLCGNCADAVIGQLFPLLAIICVFFVSGNDSTDWSHIVPSRLIFQITFLLCQANQPEID